MVILLTGITGFLGSQLASVLRAAGHRVVGTQRRQDTAGDALYADFMHDVDPATWVPRLQGVDIVINAVGILRETASQSFEAIHTRAPQALFRACVTAGVKRVIQISALGADEGTGDYFGSKRAADEVLATLPIDWVIVQPSLVYAPGGTSARLFTLLATLPFIPLPGRGEQQVQPIHIDDLTAAIRRLCELSTELRRRIPLVGPKALPLREMLQQLRRTLSLAAAPCISVPMGIMRAGALVAGMSNRSLLSPATLAMLNAGNTANPEATAELLGHPPREVAHFIPSAAVDSTVTLARLTWLLPVLRVSIALVWIWTGIVSLGLYPREASLDLLERTGVPSASGPLMLYGAALLDLMLGTATLFFARRRALWLTQIGLITLYSVIITLKLPEFWLHPYGPMLKNLPMLAAIYCLYVLERPSWNT